MDKRASAFSHLRAPLFAVMCTWLKTYCSGWRHNAVGVISTNDACCTHQQGPSFGEGLGGMDIIEAMPRGSCFPLYLISSYEPLYNDQHAPRICFVGLG
ncbi:hypothetical protein M434DRAFT_105194 [Hypoxylon sp. CO27-5]|nr:hypothetical protein M434DRAFT_105194 [Hypoxylon sp. CO27-5]